MTWRMVGGRSGRTLCAAAAGLSLLVAACSTPTLSLPGAPSPSGKGAGSAHSGVTSSLPYRANWSGGLGGWTTSEDWAVVGGKLVCQGKQLNERASAVAPVDLGDVDGFAVEAEIQLLQGDDRDGFGSFGVMTRVQDDGRGYQLGPDGDNVLRLATAPFGESLDKQPFTAGDGWHKYRIEVKENELRAFVDGAPTLSTTDNTYLTGKRVGLWAFRAQLNVRSFTVTPLN